MALPGKDMQAAIAVTRFGLGARPGEIDAAKDDPRGWLTAQITRDGADQPASDGESAARRLSDYRDYQQAIQTARKAGDQEAAKAAQRDRRMDVGQDFLARAQLGAATEAGFRERWALFWANHFTVSATKQITSAVVGPFEQEAIRPLVFGRFEDLLVASSSHPAMLTYLDQAQSVGPESPQAARAQKRGRRAGLNENLAREILELHTVGVNGGYTQADVTEFARAMTGWSIARTADEAADSAFLFRTATHEPGERTVMGRVYGQQGMDQARAIMADLATRPATARHCARKIAAHFVADDPPPALVQRLEKAWLSSEGRLDVVAKALINSPEAWEPAPAKFKTPYEFMISTWRAVGAQPNAINQLTPTLNGLGQPPFRPPSPEGWPDDASSWAAPDALIKRMVWSQTFAARTADQLDPNAIAAGALGARLSEPVAKAVARAESRPEAFAILLMSPEFQRR
ncbi:DUF1800 domain-containing protein [Caulobacter sp. NIBR2454]|uniref:DUF1800 domain-containing protein n=1 Tax=Caulobacter sp. NIBR2454 TaxID=3015996 RepID=UPI0022B63D4D|nr:DUF1800 family protein [Caulobacter sp. NIBR2454]